MTKKGHSIVVFPTVDQYKRLEGERDALKAQISFLLAVLKEAQGFIATTSLETHSIHHTITTLLATAKAQRGTEIA